MVSELTERPRSLTLGQPVVQGRMQCSTGCSTPEKKQEAETYHGPPEHSGRFVFLGSCVVKDPGLQRHPLLELGCLERTTMSRKLYD